MAFFATKFIEISVFYMNSFIAARWLFECIAVSFCMAECLVAGRVQEEGYWMTVGKEELLHLQNGSDIRGVAIKTESEAITLTGEAVNRIAGAFASWLQQKTKKAVVKIGVGYDSRLSAPELSAAALGGLIAAGAKVIDCGLASTPAMFMGTVYKETAFDGSIMITASHLPYNRNGMKFFTAAGGLEKAEITEVLELAARQPFSGSPTTKIARQNLLGLYSEHLQAIIRQAAANGEKPLVGLHIVVDASNGAGGFFAGQVLAPLGADVTGSQFLEPDGNFPNHIPNPEDPGAMAALRDAVLKHQADIGIVFDPDVDRMSAVLSDGEEINRDALIAMMAAIAVKECPGATIVTDSVTSDHLTEFLETGLSCCHRRFKRGYKNVINECKRLNQSGVESPLAIETSGHGAFRENYYLDDGCYMAVRLIIAAVLEKRQGRTLADMIARLVRAAECREYRIKIDEKDFRTYGERVVALFEQRAAAAGINIVPGSCEGVRVQFHDEVEGWALLRTSLHDPVLALNMEGAQKGDCDKIYERIRGLLADCTSLLY